MCLIVVCNAKWKILAKWNRSLSVTVRLTFTDEKTKGTAKLKTKCSTVNFLLKSVFTEQNGGKERGNFSLCTRKMNKNE